MIILSIRVKPEQSGAGARTDLSHYARHKRYNLFTEFSGKLRRILNDRRVPGDQPIEGVVQAVGEAQQRVVETVPVDEYSHQDYKRGPQAPADLVGIQDA